MKQTITIITSIIIGSLLTGIVLAETTRTFNRVEDDTVSEVETLPVVFDKETIVEERMTLNDTISEIASLDSDIARLQARRAELVILQTQIQTELDKLPARVKPKADVMEM